MGGKKRKANEYGRYNVQHENARGQVKYETPNQQRLYLINRIERQQIQKNIHAEEQKRQQPAEPSPAIIPQSRVNPFSRNQNVDGERIQNRSNVGAGTNVIQNQQVLGSSLFDDIEQDNNQQREPFSQEQQFSQQYSQIIGNSQQRSTNLIDPEISFTSSYRDLASFPVRAKGREIFLRTQSTFHLKMTEIQRQAQFMEDRFIMRPADNMINLKIGPTFEESQSDEYKKQARDQYAQLKSQFLQQNAARPNMNPFRAVQQEPLGNILQLDIPQSDILSIRSSQQSQNSSSDQQILFSNLLNLQSQESVEDIIELENMQSQATQPVKKNEKKEQKRKSIHQKFQSKYQQYQEAVRLNPEIASFNQKELRQHFSQPQINYYKKLAAIEMRYGSTNIQQINFESTQASIKDISKKLGLKYYSVVTILRRFRLQGRLKTKKQIIHKQSKMSKYNFTYILDPQILKEWAPFSLEKRCELIYQRSQVKISRVTLANYYKQHKIKYGKPQYTIHSTKNEEELKEDRKKFITTIVDYYRRNLEIIYIDECSTHLWEKKNRVWVPRMNNVNIKLPTSRKESVTVIGAISSHNDKLYYCFCNSTNRNDILFFFEGLNSEKSDLRLKGKVVVLDNHSSHITLEIREYIQRQGATILFLPVASSYFNPIETMWAWIKAKWRKKLIEPLDYNPDKEYLLRELQKICDTVPPHVVRHISAHCFKILKSYIEEKLLH